MRKVPTHPHALHCMWFLIQSQRQEYAGVLDHTPLQLLNDEGYPLLLRHALDESSTAMISIAVQAIHSLMILNTEEVR